MTTPVEPTRNQITPLASVDELILQARRFGLIWDLRPATVTDISGTSGAYEPSVLMDGDVQIAVIPVASLIGPVAPGMRVMVMHVPPVGNYIIGMLSITAVQRFEIGALASHGTSVTTVETVMETFTSFAVLPGAAYRYEIDGALVSATTTNTRFRIRKTNTAGQSLGASDAWQGTGISIAPFRHVGYFRNSGVTTITSNLVLTAVTNASTSTWYADAELPRYVSIQYAGPAVEFPSAVGIT